MISTQETIQTYRICDIYGKSYELIHSLYPILSHWEVKDDRQHIAKADCTLNESFLNIGELNVIRSHRQMGIGTEILKNIIHWAKGSHISCIAGSITESDTNSNPKLISWYQSLGFHYNVDQDNPHFIGMIEMKV